MNRTIVLRCSQRPNSRRIDVQALLELNGRAYAIPRATAAVVNPSAGLIDQDAARQLVIAVTSAIRAWDEMLPLFGDVR